MGNEFLYAMLEITYAQKNGIADDEQYSSNIQRILPYDWYRLSLDDRINILDEAIANSIPLNETECYKNLYPEDALTSAKNK